MPRWLLWTISIVAVLGLAFVALVFWPAGAPFRFLQGQKAHSLDLPGSSSGGMFGGTGVDAFYYTFQADYDKLSKTATAELKAAGYEGQDMGAAGQDQRSAMFYKGDPFGGSVSTTGSTGTPTLPEMSMVYLIEDLRMRPEMLRMRSMPEVRDKGWVTVMIIGTRPKTPIEKFKEWIGL